MSEPKKECRHPGPQRHDATRSVKFTKDGPLTSTKYGPWNPPIDCSVDDRDLNNITLITEGFCTDCGNYRKWTNWYNNETLEDLLLIIQAAKAQK